MLEGLYTHPFIDIAGMREKLRLSFPAAAELIQRFVDAELLAEITGRERYRVYNYFPYVRLFSEVR